MYPPYVTLSSWTVSYQRPGSSRSLPTLVRGIRRVQENQNTSFVTIEPLAKSRAFGRGQLFDGFLERTQPAQVTMIDPGVLFHSINQLICKRARSSIAVNQVID